MKKLFALIVVASLATSAVAQDQMLTAVGSPAPTLDGFTTFIVTLSGTEPVNGIDGSFTGNFSQINPFGLATVFTDQNAGPFGGIPEEPGDDSQFLFPSTGGPLVDAGSSMEDGNTLAAAFTNLTLLPDPFDPTNFELAQVVVPNGETFNFAFDLDVNGMLVQIDGTLGDDDMMMMDDPVLAAELAAGLVDPIDLSGIFGIATPDVLADAITLSNSGGGDLGDITVEIQGDDAGIFGFEVNGLSVSLTLDSAAAAQLAPGTQDATLVISSTGNTGAPLSFGLTANVPEPATFGLAGLALVGVAGLRRRV